MEGVIGLPPGGIETPSQEGDSEQGGSAGRLASESGSSPVRGLSLPRRSRRLSPASSVPSWLGEASAEEVPEI